MKRNETNRDAKKEKDVMHNWNENPPNSDVNTGWVKGLN